jgi:hypothetical protein
MNIASFGPTVDRCFSFTIFRIGFINSLCFCFVRPLKYVPKSNVKFRISWTQKFLSSESFWTNTTELGSRIVKALAKAILPVAVLAVSNLAITPDNSGASKCLTSAAFNAVSIIACSLTMKVQSLSENVPVTLSPRVARIHSENSSQCLSRSSALTWPSSGSAMISAVRMILNLALLFVFGLASIQFSFINREDLPHGIAEFGGWFLDLVNRCRHGATVSFHDRERKTYTSDMPSVAIIKSVRNSRPQSIFSPLPSCVNRNE